MSCKPDPHTPLPFRPERTINVNAAECEGLGCETTRTLYCSTMLRYNIIIAKL